MNKKTEIFEQAYQLYQYIEQEQTYLALALLTTNPELAYYRQIYVGISTISIAIESGNLALVSHLLDFPKAAQEYTLFDLLYYVPKENSKEITNIIDDFIRGNFAEDIVGIVLDGEDSIPTQEPINPVCYNYISGFYTKLEEMLTVKEFLPGLATVDFDQIKQVELMVNCLGALIKFYHEAGKNDQLRIAIEALFELMQKSLVFKSDSKRRINNLIVSWCYRAAGDLLDISEYQYSFILLKMAKIVNVKLSIPYEEGPLKKQKKREKFAREHLEYCHSLIKKMLDLQACNEACVYADLTIATLKKILGDEVEDLVQLDFYNMHVVHAFLQRKLWSVVYLKLKTFFDEASFFDHYPAASFDYFVEIFEEFCFAYQSEGLFFDQVQQWAEIIQEHRLRRVINGTHLSQQVLIKQLNGVDYHGMHLLIDYLKKHSMKTPIKRERLTSHLCDFVQDLLSRQQINGSKNSADELSLITFFLRAAKLDWNRRVQNGQYAGWNLWMLNCVQGFKVSLLESIVNECDINAVIASGKDRGLTALHLAVRAANLPAINCLLDNGANPNAGSISLLAFSLQQGLVQIAERLLQSEQVSVQNETAKTPILLLAIEKGYLQVIIRLVARGANPNGTNAIGAKKSLHVALQSYKKNEDRILHYLLNNPKIDCHALYHGESPVLIATRLGIDFAVEKLLALNVDVHATATAGAYIGHDAVSLAVDQGRLAIVELFIRKNKVNYSKLYYFGEEPKTIVEIAAKDSIIFEKLQAHWLATDLDQVRRYLKRLFSCADIASLQQWMDVIETFGASLLREFCDEGSAEALEKIEKLVKLPAHEQLKIILTTRNEACLRILLRSKYPAPSLRAAFNADNPLLVNLLLDIFYDEQKLEFELRRCLEAGQLDLFMMVAKYWFEIVPDSLFLLDLAVKTNNNELVAKALSIYENSKNVFKFIVSAELDSHKNTFMHQVCASGNNEIIDQFVSMGAEIPKQIAEGAAGIETIQDADLCQPLRPEVIDEPGCRRRFM